MELFLSLAIFVWGLSIWCFMALLISCGFSLLYSIFPKNAFFVILFGAGWLVSLIMFTYKLIVSGNLFYEKLLILIG